MGLLSLFTDVTTAPKTAQASVTGHWISQTILATEFTELTEHRVKNYTEGKDRSPKTRAKGTQN
jgi:hypothetical protein